MDTIEDRIVGVAQTTVDAIRAGRWSSPRSGALMRHARLVLQARAFGGLDDALIDTFAVAARTEIASARAMAELEACLPALRDWQSSPRAMACRAYEEHGPYSDANGALAVAMRTFAVRKVKAA